MSWKLWRLCISLHSGILNQRWCSALWEIGLFCYDLWAAFLLGFGYSIGAFTSFSNLTLYSFYEIEFSAISALGYDIYNNALSQPGEHLNDYNGMKNVNVALLAR